MNLRPKGPHIDLGSCHSLSGLPNQLAQFHDLGHWLVIILPEMKPGFHVFPWSMVCTVPLHSVPPNKQPWQSMKARRRFSSKKHVYVTLYPSCSAIQTCYTKTRRNRPEFENLHILSGWWCKCADIYIYRYRYRCIQINLIKLKTIATSKK